MPSGASPRDTSTSAARTDSACASLSLTPSQAPSFSSAALPYLPAGTASTLAVASRPPLSGAARSKPGRMSTLRLASFVEIRRDEDVGRRPLLDLLDERVAGRIGNRRLLAGLALPLRGDLVERVLQARSGEHENVAALCRGRTGACGPCQDRHGRQGEPATPRHYHYKPPGALYSDISSEHSRILRRFNAGTGQNCRGTALRQGFSLIAWADGRYLNSAQARVSQAGSDAARLET